MLDLRGNVDSISLKGGGQSFLNRLQVILSTRPEPRTPTPPPPPADAPLAFAQEYRRLLGQHLVSCEERFAAQESGGTLTVVVDRDAASWSLRLEEIRQ